MYSEKLCEALCTVLDAAARLPRRRLAGYTANLGFWIDEIEHRLRLIDGLIARRRQMIAGAKAVNAEEIEQAKRYGSAYGPDRATDPDPRDVSDDWDKLERITAENRLRVIASAKVFLRKCVATELIDIAEVVRIEDRLGLDGKLR